MDMCSVFIGYLQAIKIIMKHYNRLLPCRYVYR
jgi:hypothetical protein